MIRNGLLAFVFTVSLFVSCNITPQPNRSQFNELEEVKIKEIPLSGALANRRAEISSLTWLGDNLVLLPQYPQMYKDEFDGNLFIIKKQALSDWVENDTVKVTHKKLGVNFNGLDEDLLSEGSGFEAITFKGHDVYLTLESGGWMNTTGYILKGKLSADSSYIDIFPESMHEILSQCGLANYSEEAILLDDSLVYTFHEVNGKLINPSPVAHSFSPDLKYSKNIPIDNIEYRITDVTSIDSLNRFWAINYQYPADWNELIIDEDYEYRTEGIGKSHKTTNKVERLVEFELKKDRIIRTNNLPVYVELGQGEDGRNWEGIVRFEGGFLLITDKYPQTILAFIDLGA